MDLILYHKGCPDGWCAAYIAQKHYPEAELLAWDQGVEPPIGLIQGREVLSVDIRWRNRESVERAQALAKKFTIIDHHASGEGNLDGLPNYIFDVTRSGAGLTWDYLFGGNAVDLMYRDGSNFQENRPWWVNYTEDRDLWLWRQPDAKKVAAAMHMFPFTVKAWDELTETHTATSLARQGEVLLRQEENYVSEIGQFAALGVLFGQRVFIANSPYQFASELGAVLCRRQPDVHISVTYYERPGEREYYFSLRGDGSVNVADICKQFPGGGGHHNAGGFHIPSKDARELIDAILNNAGGAVCLC